MLQKQGANPSGGARVFAARSRRLVFVAAPPPLPHPRNQISTPGYCAAAPISSLSC